MRLLLILLTLCGVCYAQVDMESGAALLKPVLEMVLGMLNPNVAAVMVLIGGLRMVLKPLMVLLEALALYTPGKKDDELVKKVASGNVYKTLSFVLDWLASIKLPKK